MTLRRLDRTKLPPMIVNVFGGPLSEEWAQRDSDLKPYIEDDRAQLVEWLREIQTRFDYGQHEGLQMAIDLIETGDPNEP